MRPAIQPEKRTRPSAIPVLVRSQRRISLSNSSITKDHCIPGNIVTPIKKQSVQHRLPYPSPLSPEPLSKGPQGGHHTIRSPSPSTHPSPRLQEDQENALGARLQDGYFPYDVDDKARGKGSASYLAPEYTLSTPPNTLSSRRTGYVTPLETPTKQSTRPPRSSARPSATQAKSLTPATPSTSSHNQSDSCVKKSSYICRPTTERTDLTVKVLRGFLEGIIYQLIEGLPLATPEKLSCLAQACDHPSLVQRLLEQNFEKEPFAAVLRNTFMSAKLNAMLRISQICKARGQRIAIFTCFENLIPVMIQGFNDSQIIWTTYSDEEDAECRRRSLNKIVEDRRWSVVLISVAGAALDEWDPGDWKIGLDITSCNNIIFMEPWWHREAAEQAIGLVHSGAQTLPVTVYHLIADGTIDELVLEKRT